MVKQREQWGSKLGFVLAAAGSAVGLGNIWKFPYIVGENGGAAFILVYLLSILLVGIPAVIAEILIGRSAKKDPVGTFRKLSKGNPFWIGVGFIGVIAGFLILAYYNVIAGWSLGYIIESIKNSFSSMHDTSKAGELFGQLSSSIGWPLSYSALFMLMTVGIIISGVQKGIEKASKILMPMLIIFIIILVVRGVTLPGAMKGIKYLTKVDFSVINGQTILLALGHAFFSLSLGMGALMTYGSYMSNNDDVVGSSMNVVLLDTIIAILAGFMIFPALFAMNMSPEQGPSLIFNIIPVLFNSIPGGFFFRILFFLLLSMAALTSTISLLEVIITFAVDELKMSRKKATVIFAIIVFLIGIPCALSFGIIEDATFCGLNFFEILDYLAANIFLPLGGMLISIFVGWFWKKEEVFANLQQGTKFSHGLLNLWFNVIRYIVPVIIFLVFLSSIGIFE